MMVERMPVLITTGASSEARILCILSMLYWRSQNLCMINRERAFPHAKRKRSTCPYTATLVRVSHGFSFGVSGEILILLLFPHILERWVLFGLLCCAVLRCAA
ncbi:unnamed protein product [Pseudo-nitzschia multistriata]|uniref:Uncharacterized protein n=1 Tax=Pseudo-nitzschia multistriata TaxID=183589 RepID=A0A448YYX6_9STRA|nr:unnamed protein product [Pseudo-nitzschia multistriata]